MPWRSRRTTSSTCRATSSTTSSASSPAGEIPNGDADGKVLVGSENDDVSDNVAWVAKTLAWKGKVFNREKGDLKNKILPFGIKAVRAKVYKEASWFDGKETIVLDYSKTSFLARKVRDEIREVAPGPLPRARVLGEGQGPPLLARLRPVTAGGSVGDAVPALPDDRRAGPRGRRAATSRACSRRMGDGVANGSVLDFGALDDVHFARLMMAPGGHRPVRRAAARERDPAQRLRRRRSTPTSSSSCETAGAGLDRVFGHCEGYPDGEPTARDRLDYLRRHVVKEAARYVNTSGRTVRQIRQEAALRDAIEAVLDDRRARLARPRSGRRPRGGARARRGGTRSSPGRSSRRSGRRSPRARGTRCISSPSRS